MWVVSEDCEERGLVSSFPHSREFCLFPFGWFTFNVSFPWLLMFRGGTSKGALKKGPTSGSDTRLGQADSLVINKKQSKPVEQNSY